VVGAKSRLLYPLEIDPVPINMYLIFIISAGGIASLGKKKKLSKLGPMMEKKVIPVETDTQKLVNYVCGSNLLKEGEDVKLKPDDEYPDWLWTLRTGEK
jgi:large subunit ribosomal protein L54